MKTGTNTIMPSHICLPVVNSVLLLLLGGDMVDRVWERYRVVYTTGATSYLAMIILYGSRPISDEYMFCDQR